MKRQTVKSLFILTILFFLSVALYFTSTVLADQGHNHDEHEFNFSLFSLVRPLGICALGLLLATFSTGLFRKEFGKHSLKTHRTLAWLTIIVALSHGILVLVLY